jgi:PAS domain S-box-containing protein
MALPRIYFEKLLESSLDIVVAVDREGSIVFYNDGARQTLGYTSEEVRGRPVELLYPSRDEAKRVMRAMRSAEHAEPGKVKNFETIFTAKDGEQIPVAISGSLITDEHGQPMGSIGFAKDLRKIRRRDQLATLGEIAVSLAHEINNPLEVITNTLELIEGFLRRVASDEQMVIEGERIETVERELAKIQAIVNRVQEMSQRGEYETRQYLPGTLMTDLREQSAPDAPPQPAGAGALAGLHILVVDDDLGVCQSLAELLRAQGCEVVMATSAAEALGILAHRRFDLVLSDVVMPDMDGYDLYMELKEHRPDLPVILMTGYLYDRDHVIKRSKLAGLASNVLFKKPIDPERLKAIILAQSAKRKETAHGRGRDAGRDSPLS